MATSSIDANLFYKEYHGHTIAHLEQLLTHFKTQYSTTNYIYFAGDSSLDNKFWLSKEKNRPAVNGYETILNPTRMVPDVAYFLNKVLSDSNTTNSEVIDLTNEDKVETASRRSRQSKTKLNDPRYIAINAAIEESTLGARQNGKLLPQDEFVKRNITERDILVVSVGGNDIALRPTLTTAWNALLMNYCNSLESLESAPLTAWGVPHFLHLFRDQVRDFVTTLLGPVKPKKVVICMIYYPDEAMTSSWADRTLGALGYNSDPRRLQAAIRQIFIHGTSKIQIEGVQVVPFPMFESLDGKDSIDYVQRVEPSGKGGEKLARSLLAACM